MDENKDQTKKTKIERFYCKCCDLYTNSNEQLNQHLTGIRHSQKTLGMNNEMTYCCNIDCKANANVYVSLFILFSISAYFYFYVMIKLIAYY